MGIRLDDELCDAQGLPVVSWVEDRNLYAPDGIGVARVTCFLRPDESGLLQFVSAGRVREGAFEEARPWELLKSFQEAAAEQLYTTQTDKVWRDILASRSKSGVARGLLTDGARVMLANFADGHSSVAMHLNCAEASMVDMARLHDRLHNEFIIKRPLLMRQKCGPDRRWPKEPAFVAYTPPAPPASSFWMERLADLIVVAVLGLFGFGFYWLVIR
jgi:hypothetical protein